MILNCILFVSVGNMYLVNPYLTRSARRRIQEHNHNMTIRRMIDKSHRYGIHSRRMGYQWLLPIWNVRMQIFFLEASPICNVIEEFGCILGIRAFSKYFKRCRDPTYTIKILLIKENNYKYHRSTLMIQNNSCLS